jgi:hypothetical protein
VDNLTNLIYSIMKNKNLLNPMFRVVKMYGNAAVIVCGIAAVGFSSCADNDDAAKTCDKLENKVIQVNLSASINAAAAADNYKSCYLSDYRFNDSIKSAADKAKFIDRANVLKQVETNLPPSAYRISGNIGFAPEFAGDSAAFALGGKLNAYRLGTGYVPPADDENPAGGGNEDNPPISSPTQWSLDSAACVAYSVPDSSCAVNNADKTIRKTYNFEAQKNAWLAKNGTNDSTYVWNGTPLNYGSAAYNYQAQKDACTAGIWNMAAHSCDAPRGTKITIVGGPTATPYDLTTNSGFTDNVAENDTILTDGTTPVDVTMAQMNRVDQKDFLHYTGTRKIVVLNNTTRLPENLGFLNIKETDTIRDKHYNAAAKGGLALHTGPVYQIGANWRTNFLPVGSNNMVRVVSIADKSDMIDGEQVRMLDLFPDYIYTNGLLTDFDSEISMPLTYSSSAYQGMKLVTEDGRKFGFCMGSCPTNMAAVNARSTETNVRMRVAEYFQILYNVVIDPNNLKTW